MINILDEKEISFKELDQKIFQYVCELGCEITKMILERYDDELSGKRDKEKYRDKGKRKTSIKTVYVPLNINAEYIKLKQMMGKKQEMKVFTMYEGWNEEKERQKRSTLVGKRILAGWKKVVNFTKSAMLS